MHRVRKWKAERVCRVVAAWKVSLKKDEPPGERARRECRNWRCGGFVM